MCNYDGKDEDLDQVEDGIEKIVQGHRQGIISVHAIPYHPICRHVSANRPSRRASMCRPTFDHALWYLLVKLKNLLSWRTKEHAGVVWHYLKVHWMELIEVM